MHPIENMLNRIPKPGFIDLFFREVPFFRKAYISLLGKLFNLFPYYSGVDILDKDWDYLIVLDACRYDIFEKHYENFLDGNLEKKISKGPITSKWIKENFNRNCEDIVYVTGQVMPSKFRLKELIGFVPFHYIEDVWDYGWNDDLNTVPPENMEEPALRISEKFPDKRMIIHYLQPHHPFIADQKEPEMRKKIEGGEGTWKAVARGAIPLDWAKQAYEKNLKYVLTEVRSLVDQLEGKIIVTADHGDSFGEYWIYGHQSEETYLTPLIEVPWLVIEKGTKRKARTEKERVKGKVKDLKLSEKL